jgi:hypothetical protein
MATEAQVFANRSNAQKSTGPRTAEGKATVAQNAVKHGLSARLDVIKGEDQAEFDLHREAMLGELGPVGPMESMLAERVVSLSWRLKRVERIQNEVFDALLADRSSPLAKLVQSLSPKAAGRPEGGSDGDGDLALGRVALKDFSNSRVLDRLLMYERRIEHSLYKTMAELQRLRLLRELDPPTAEPMPEAAAPVCSVPAWGEHPRSPEEVGRGRPTYEETPHGATMNALATEASLPAAKKRLTASLRADESCKTKPIFPEPNEGQVPGGERVMGIGPDFSVVENKAKQSRFSECGGLPTPCCVGRGKAAVGPQDAVAEPLAGRGENS